MEKATKIKLRWKLKPALSGLMRVGAKPRGSVLYDGEKVYAHLDWLRSGGWYWTAGWDSDIPKFNSCETPLDSSDDAKAQAMAYVKKHIGLQV